MASHGYRAAPVIDCKTGDVLGLLTVTDLLRALFRLAKENGDLQLTMDAKLCDGLNYYHNNNNNNGFCQSDTSAPSDIAGSGQWRRPAPVFVLAEYKWVFLIWVWNIVLFNTKVFAYIEDFLIWNKIMKHFKT